MKRILVFLVSAALVAGAFYAVPVAAQEAPAVPENPNIVDPAGDGNALNDQGGGLGIGDNPTPVNLGAPDILNAWFTNDAETFSIHINTTLPPPNSVFGLMYRTFFTEASGCTFIDVVIPSVTYVGDQYAKVECGDTDVEGEVKIETAAEDTGITTATFKRADSPLFATGSTLAAPFMQARGYEGSSATGGLIVPVFDSTKPGTDFVVSSGAEEAKKTPPGKNDPPGKKKGCKKGKGKKRGCEGKGRKSPKKGKPKAACAPFAPGEAGKDKPLVTLTDAATEEKPVEQTVTLDPSTADVAGAASHDAFNIQVDPKAAETGLYALIEFMDRNDYDLNLLHTDGSYAARSRAFNTVIEVNDQVIPGLGFPLSESGHGGESTAGSEKLVGIKTADCGGWTLDVANYLGMGGEMTVKLWLGEAKIDPQEPGAEPPV